MRHTGMVRLHTEPEGEGDTVLLCEMTKRTLKNVLRERLRTSTLSSRQTQYADVSEYDSRQCVVQFLNLVCGSHASSDALWVGVVRGMRSRFGDISTLKHRPFPFSLTGSSEKEDTGVVTDCIPSSLSLSPSTSHYSGPQLRDKMRSHFPSIIEYALASVGLQLSPSCVKEVRSSGVIGSSFEFTSVDITGGPIRVKHMTILSYLEGKLLSFQGSTHLQQAPNVASRLFALSSGKFVDALASDPTNLAASREAVLCEASCALADKQIEKADHVLLSSLERCLERGGSSIRQLYVVTLPLLSRLFELWSQRRDLHEGRCLASFSHCGGASSVKAILRLDSIMTRYRTIVQELAAQVTFLMYLLTYYLLYFRFFYFFFLSLSLPPSPLSPSLPILSFRIHSVPLSSMPCSLPS